MTPSEQQWHSALPSEFVTTNLLPIWNVNIVTAKTRVSRLRKLKVIEKVSEQGYHGAGSTQIRWRKR